MENPQINQKSINVVSDWQKLSSKKQVGFNLALSMALAIAFVCTSLLFFLSKSQNHNLIVNNNVRYMQVSGMQEADLVEKSLEGGTVLISNIAERYASMISLLPDKDVTERLQLLSDNNLFDRIGHVSPDGTDITLEGNTNVSDREYFQRGISGETGYDFLVESRVTGKPCVVFYSPIRYNDEIAGVMIGFYETERLNDLFNIEMFDYSPDTRLILSDGTVVADKKNNADCTNILTELSSKEFVGDTDFNDLKKAIDDNSRTSVQFEFIEDDGELSVGVITQFQNYDWLVMSTLPGDITSAMENQVNKTGIMLLVGITIVFLVLITLILVMIYRQNKRANSEMIRVQDTLKLVQLREQEHRFIVDTLADTYSSVYLIDIAKSDFVRLEETQDTTVNALPEKGNWQDMMSKYIEYFVDEAYQYLGDNLYDTSLFEEEIGDNSSYSVEYMRKDGAWRRLYLFPAKRDESGKLISVICAVQRIDTEKQKELLAKKALMEAYDAAKFANSAKTSFLSNMSHDIRTPMNAIIGMTMIASKNLDDPDKISDCLKKITSSSNHLLALINEILDMSKIESGKVELSEEAFNLNELIDDLVNINGVLVKEKNHTLTINTDGLTHTNVIGDKTRLQQVFTNLLTNAIKYTPAGGKLDITVTDDTASSTAVGQYKAIFRDNGIGMSKEYMKNLFEPFTRARDKRLVGIQGTGLGMPITRNILQMMNGDIKVESELNKGSSFTITFMLKLQPESELEHNVESVDNDDAVSADLSGKRILLVEDNELNLEIATEILSMLNAEIETAENGKVATEKFASSSPDYYDLILMDIQMPTMDGYEATAVIRASAHPNAKSIPIVAMTANAFASDVKTALESGMNAHISKPIDITNLIKTLNRLI